MLTDESLHRRVVLSSDGVVVGEISRLVIRPSDWHVQAFVVKLRKEAAERAGIARSVFHAPTLEISTDLVQSSGDAVILSVPVEALNPPAESPPSASEPAPLQSH